MAGNKALGIKLSDVERETLERRSRRRKIARAEAQRAEIVLRAADGANNCEIAASLGVTRQTVRTWRARFAKDRLDGLSDEPRCGAPRQIGDDRIEAIVVKTLEEKPADATHWSTRGMAKAAGVSTSSVHRIWRAFSLQPHRSETFKLSSDPQFIEKVRDIVGLYLDPPDKALVICVDEKSQIQALDRTQPLLPMRPGQIERRTHDYERHGTTTLFAAFIAAVTAQTAVKAGEVIGRCKPRHRSSEFRAFLDEVEHNVPAELEIHVVMDNASSHKTKLIRDWFAKRPRWHMHFTPTSSSWLNQVERFFALLTEKKIKRGAHSSTTALIKDIESFIDNHNANPSRYAGPSPPTTYSHPSNASADARSTRGKKVRVHRNFRITTLASNRLRHRMPGAPIANVEPGLASWGHEGLPSTQELGQPSAWTYRSLIGSRRTECGRSSKRASPRLKPADTTRTAERQFQNRQTIGSTIMTTAPEFASSDLHDLTASEAAAMIRDGAVTSERYSTVLLHRHHEREDMNAFITVDDAAVLEAAAAADRHRAAGKPLGPLHGVPIAVKDSMNTSDLPTSLGTRVLREFRPRADAPIVRALRDAGAIIFGKNNLVEMSYGLTGLNAHYGQAKNPYDGSRVSGGSSGGAGASVGARLVPAALGGDTVGSIRIPSSFSGVVGLRPTTGRWSGRGIGPISHTFDTPGPMARSVEDVALIDAVVTGANPPSPRPVQKHMKGVRLGVAPAQHLEMVDDDVHAAFREALAKLSDVGAEIVEIDLGDDFNELAYRANWPIFFHETMPNVREYLEDVGAPATFEDIYGDLGENVDFFWSDAVVAGAPNYVSKEAYLQALTVDRPTLQDRYARAYRASGLDALLFPTTPITAPPIGTAAEITVGGVVVPALNIARNVFPSSCAGLPGISLPIALSSAGLPIGMELDGVPGGDKALLDLAGRIAAAIGEIPAPRDPS